MVSNRYRANRAFTNKTSSLESRNSTLRKRTSNPHLGAKSVTGKNVSDGTVVAGNVGADAVNDTAVSRGAVGTENLGVVNALSSDSGMSVSLSSPMSLEGSSYATPPLGVTYPMGHSSDKAVKQSGSVWAGVIDPMWTSGLPQITMTGGAVVSASGWADSIPTPKPGDSVRMVWDGSGWMIIGGIVAGDDTLYSVSLIPYLQAPWLVYDTNWHEPAVTKTPDGIVMLHGLIRQTTGTLNTNTLICTLPAEFRPDVAGNLTFPVAGGNSELFRVQVMPNGQVWWITGGSGLGSGGFMSLNGVTFPAAGVATWTNIAAAGTATVAAFATGWSNFVGGGQPPAGYWIDPYGLAWWRGEIVSSGPVSVDNTNMILFNSQPLKPTLELHFPSFRGGGLLGGVGTNNVSNALRYKAVGTLSTGTQLSLAGVTVPTVASDTALSWTTASYANSWGSLSAGSYPAAAYASRNGLTYYKGLMAAGVIGASAFFTPAEAVGRGWYTNPNSGYSGIYARLCNMVFGRLDVGSGGAITPTAGSNAWYSIDGLMTPREIH